jgi:hypothetical protein
MRRRSWGPAALVAAVILSGCGEDPERADTDAPADATSDDGLAPWCDDLPPLGEVAEGNLAGMENADDHVLGVIKAYTAQFPDTFAGDWIDRDRGGTYVVAFTDEAETRLAEILALPLDGPSISGTVAPATTATADTSGATTIPGVTERPDPSPPPPSTEAPSSGTVGDSGTVVDTVEATYTEAELSALQDEAMDRLADAGLDVSGVGSVASTNRLQLDMGFVEDDVRQQVAALFPRDSVCVAGSASYEPPPTIDPAAPPTLLPPEGSDPQVTCGGEEGFPLSALDNPLGFESTDHPVAAALRESLASGEGAFLAGEGSWRLLVENGEVAVVAQGDPPHTIMSFEWTGDRWIWAGMSSGACETRVVLPPGLGEADWMLDPAFPDPAPADTELHLQVTERACTGASEIGDRLVGPEIRETDGEVIVAFAVLPLEGDVFTCPGNPPLAVTVTLDAPLGDRVLADGAYLPPRPADQPPSDR